MIVRPFVWHVAASIVIGGAISYFTPIKWLAAALFVSAGLFINGSIAYVEDGLPGGFDNPDGNNTPEYAKGWGASKFALRSFSIFAALIALGLLVQYEAWKFWF